MQRKRPYFVEGTQDDRDKTTIFAQADLIKSLEGRLRVCHDRCRYLEDMTGVEKRQLVDEVKSLL
jgi:hypothetical protein